MGFLDRLGPEVRGILAAANPLVAPVVDGAERVANHAGDAGRRLGDFWHRNPGEQPLCEVSVDSQVLTAEQLVPIIRNGRGTSGWHGAVGIANRLADSHDRVHGAIITLLGEFEHAWTGTAADAAGARLAPLVDVTRAAGESLAANAANLSDTACAFDEMKSRIEPLPDVPPHKNLWDTVTPWDTDTEDAVNRYNDTAQRDLEHCRAYDTTSSGYRGRLSNDYGWLDGFGDDVTVLPAASPHRMRHDLRPPRPGRHPRDPEPQHRPARPPAPHRVVPPHVARQHVTPQHVTPQHVARPPETPRQHDNENQVVSPENAGPESPRAFGSPHRSGRTTAASVVPPVPGAGTPTGSAPGTGVPGADVTYPPGRAGMPGGAPDACTGAGAPVEERATGRSAAGAATGARGAVGTPGVGPAGGGRGEDREHERKYDLADGSVFVEDKQPGGAIDPRTGLRIAPPTIGG